VITAGTPPALAVNGGGSPLDNEQPPTSESMAGWITFRAAGAEGRDSTRKTGGSRPSSIHGSWSLCSRPAAAASCERLARRCGRPVECLRTRRFRERCPREKLARLIESQGAVHLGAEYAARRRIGRSAVDRRRLLRPPRPVGLRGSYAEASTLKANAAPPGRQHRGPWRGSGSAAASTAERAPRTPALPRWRAPRQA
jgi:hypothetical protein